MQCIVDIRILFCAMVRGGRYLTNSAYKPLLTKNLLAQNRCVTKIKSCFSSIYEDWRF